MMIVDAIRSACTPHAVYFLVTAYIESLRHFERSCAAPEHVLDLPIAGTADLAQRVRVLERNTTVPPESAVAASELATVLACALERVEAFDPPAAAAAAAAHRGTTPHERNDNRRSARSV